MPKQQSTKKNKLMRVKKSKLSKGEVDRVTKQLDKVMPHALFQTPTTVKVSKWPTITVKDASKPLPEDLQTTIDQLSL
jgi:hypothetical protein